MAEETPLTIYQFQANRKRRVFTPGSVPPKAPRFDFDSTPQQTRMNDISLQDQYYAKLLEPKLPRRKYTKGQRRAFNKNSLYADKVERALYPSDTYYRQYQTRNAGSLARYGASYATATPEQRANRQADRVMGRGRFNLPGFARQLRGANRVLGTTRMTNALAGAAFGKAMSAMGGSGMYSGRSRALGGRGRYLTPEGAPFQNDSSRLEMGQLFFKPHFQGDGSNHDDGGLVIMNQEFIQNVYGNDDGTSFSSTSFSVNPGLAEIFPMLSQMAANFERYEMIQCVFHFETQLDAGIIQSSTGQVGDILMYSHSDPKQPELQNVSEFQINGGNSVRVTHGAAVGVECDPTMLEGLPNAGINYVRTGPKEDVSEYDQGKVQVAVSNTPSDLAGQVIGKLYVSYTVRLIKPKLMSYFGRGQFLEIFQATGNLNAAGHYLNNFVVGTTYTANDNSNIGCSVVSNTSSSTGAADLTITFPSYYQGLCEIIIETQSDNSTTDPNDPSEISDKFAASVTTTGEISRPNMLLTPELTSGTGVAVINEASSTQKYGLQFFTSSGDTSYSSGGFWRGVFRISPALTTDNTITIESDIGTAVCASAVNGATTVMIRTINDFGAVGTQSLSDVAFS